jgi:DNA-binding FadR family transcriptional regulator
MASRKTEKKDPKPIPIAPSGSVMRPMKTAELAARDIVHQVMAEGLGPGDSLPSEAVMLKQLGYSRESLREALRLLEVQGMITLRRGPGGGPIVGTVDPANLGRIEALFFHMAGASYDELLEAWVTAQALLAARAAAHPEPEVRRATMEPYLRGEAEDDHHSDLTLFVRGHGGFHSAVGSLARNRVLELTLAAYGQIVTHHIATVGDPRPLHDALIEEHLELAQAIIDGEAEKASALMESHLRNVIAYIKDHVGDRLEGLIEWL